VKGNSATESRPKIGIWLARWSKHIIYLLAMITSKFTRTTTNKVKKKKRAKVKVHNGTTQRLFT
jgi:hypothetical protein